MIQSPFQKYYCLSQSAPRRFSLGMSWHTHDRNCYLCGVEEIMPGQTQMKFCWSPAWGTLGHPLPSWWWSWQNCTDSVRITGLHVCGPCWIKTAANFHPGIQRVENETYLFFLWILLGTQHGYPAWNLTPRTTQGLRLFCLFVFLKMEWPPEEWPAFPHSCGFFSLWFLLPCGPAMLA